MYAGNGRWHLLGGASVWKDTKRTYSCIMQALMHAGDTHKHDDDGKHIVYAAQLSASLSYAT